MTRQPHASSADAGGLDPGVRRRLAQFVRTSHLFGVDVVPIRRGATLAATPHKPDGDGIGTAAGSEPAPPVAPVARPVARPSPLAVVEIEAAPVARPVAAAARPVRDVAVPGDVAAGVAGVLAELEARYEEFCPAGTIATEHTRVVFGEGRPDADLMFIGEAPGADEDRLGRPFVGRAGQKLDEIIQAMGLQRADVYITNIVKIRPPGNRTPLQSELDACFPLLRAQIAVIRPKVIVTLGGPSTKTVLETRTGISQLRGTWSEYVDEGRGLRVPVMPTFHPAYLLRQYTPENRRLVWSDMKAVIDRLGPGSG